MSEEENKKVEQESLPEEQPAQTPSEKPKFSLKTWIADKVVLVRGKLFGDKTKNGSYISGKESRDIAKRNRKTIRELQKQRASYKREDYLTQMKDDKNIVEFEDLHTYFFSDNGVVKAVNGVTFSIPQGSTVGVVGESGCGKSVTSLSLMQLVQGPMGQIVSGSEEDRRVVLVFPYHGAHAGRHGIYDDRKKGRAGAHRRRRRGQSRA